MRRGFLLLLLAVQLGSSSVGFCADGYKKVHRQLKKKSLGQLQKTGEKKQNSALLRAINATRVLNKKYKHPGVGKKRFLQSAYYLETHLPRIKHSSKHYLTKKKTGLKHDLEYDPVTGHAFVVLKSKKAYIGSGAKKTVHKTIHYKHHDPKVLARCEQTIPMPHERKALKELGGVPGVMTAHALTKHKHKGKKYYTVYSDCYKGTLSSLYEKKEISFRNKLIIMCDLLRGLESLHSRNYVHRDLHAYNYLIFNEKQPNGTTLIRAVIADLGRTIKTRQAKKVRAQMTSRLCPPEGFKKKRLKGKDYFATDVYALGCIFHRLYHYKFPRWQTDYLRSHSLSKYKKKKKLIKKLKKGTYKRRRELLQRKARNGGLSIQNETELLILKMLNIKPSQRGTAAELRQSMQHLLHRHG